MADAQLRRRLRDEQRSISYREAVRLGLRRPHSEVRIAAAARIMERREMLGEKHSGGEIGDLYGSFASPRFHRAVAREIAKRGHLAPKQRRLRAWAERVLRETAELEG